MTLEELDVFEERHLKEMASPETRAQWPHEPYFTSKMFISTYCSIIGRSKYILEKDIQVYSAHPGWCNTNMTQNWVRKGVIPPLTKEEGAKTTLFLCDLPFEINPDLQGEYFADCAHESLINFDK